VAPQEPTRSPRPWLALTLSLGAPGLGQLYAGRRRAAFFFAALWLLLPFAVTALFTVEPLATSRPVVLAAFAALPLLLLVSGLHAGWVAGRGPGLGFGRTGLVVICVLYPVLLILAGIAVARMARATIAQPFRMPSEAMLPTLLANDYFMVDRRAFLRREPERGEVVAFRGPRPAARVAAAATASAGRSAPSRELLVARVVGLPGDVVELRGGVLRVNGADVPTRSLGRSILQHEVDARLELWEESLDGHHHRIARDPAHPSPDLGPTPVPDTRYFVLCDDRDHARDSRAFGTVPRTALLGPATFVYWSWVEPFALVRWERIGLRIDGPAPEIQ
jgi:signal peptidase I